MKSISIIIISILVNTVGLLVAANYVPGFALIGDFREIIIAAAVLTLLNATLKPFLRLFLGPIIILTLGLGLILVNAFVLYILDILLKNLTILNIPALLWGAVITGVLNLIIHIIKK